MDKKDNLTKKLLEFNKKFLEECDKDPTSRWNIKNIEKFLEKCETDCIYKTHGNGD